jgi:hypothetical protein
MGQQKSMYTDYFFLLGQRLAKVSFLWGLQNWTHQEDPRARRLAKHQCESSKTKRSNPAKQEFVKRTQQEDF